MSWTTTLVCRSQRIYHDVAPVLQHRGRLKNYAKPLVSNAATNPEPEFRNFDPITPTYPWSRLAIFHGRFLICWNGLPESPPPITG